MSGLSLSALVSSSSRDGAGADLPAASPPVFGSGTAVFGGCDWANSARFPATSPRAMATKPTKRTTNSLRTLRICLLLSFIHLQSHEQPVIVGRDGQVCRRRRL